MSDRKLPEELECPIDNLIIKYGKKLYPYFRKLQFTPNTLTTISLILGLLSSYQFYQKNFIRSSILYFISYCFDDLDGNYARTYSLTTKFGDYYDHIKDLVTNIIFFIIFLKYHQLPSYLLYPGLIAIVITFILSCLHLGCQEIYIKKGDAQEKEKASEYLSFLTKFCQYDIIYNNIEFLKYFGTGSLSILISLTILSNKFF